MSKVRIYDLAKELKLENKIVLENVRQFGCEVRVASNSVPDEIANKVRELYFPKKTSTSTVTPKIIKPNEFGGQVAAGSAPAKNSTPVTEQSLRMMSGPKLIKVPKKVVLEPVISSSEPTEAISSALVVDSALDAVEDLFASAELEKTKVRRIEVPPPQLPQAQESPAQSENSLVTASLVSQVREISIPLVPPVPPSKPAFQLRTISTPPSLLSGVMPKKPALDIKQKGKDQGGKAPYDFRRDNKNVTTSSPEKGGQAKSFTRGGPEAPSVEPAGGAAPQRTTYIPPKDNKRKGRRNVRDESISIGSSGGKRDRQQQNERNIPARRTQAIPVAPRPVFTEFKSIKVTEGTTIKELAEKLEVKPKEVVSLLFSKGLLVTINQTISEDVMKEVGRGFGFDVTIGSFEEMVAEQEPSVEIDQSEYLERRAPVVTVMGHVDHGKTSLLDAIRNTMVVAGEAGGITQHIGAYSVHIPDPDNPDIKRRIVFLDTPGHEAFTLMRARGAQGADVAIIVVAADDGVMPQTIEAIDHAKAANVPLIVAINKIDKPDANVDRVKNGLSEHGLVWDGWGGDTVMVEISAKQRLNLDSLLEMTLLTSDILDLKANPKRLASGVVLEARLDKGRGPVASVLIQQGTLRIGDPIIAGLNFGRVRALHDDTGQSAQEAGPAVPVEILGLQGVPKAGDLLQVVTDPAKAQEIAQWRQSKHRIALLSGSSARGLEEIFEHLESGKLKELLVILKADVQGSVEVLRDTLEKLSTEKVKVRVIRSDVGAITESDVLLASASNDMAHASVVIGFNVRPAPRVSDLAKQEKVDIRLHTIIYKVEEEMRKAMIGLLDPTTREVYAGRAEVRQIIKIPKIGNVAGCMVVDGLFKRGAQVRVLRDSMVIFEGSINSLRRFKDDVSEVRSGFECGISLERFNDVKEGDVFESFATEKVLQTEL